jgi:uncharacterized membrane protein
MKIAIVHKLLKYTEVSLYALTDTVHLQPDYGCQMYVLIVSDYIVEAIKKTGIVNVKYSNTYGLEHSESIDIIGV